MHLENGTYEEIVSHLQRELELTDLEAPDEMQINIVTQQAQQICGKPKPFCHHCKKPSHYRNHCRQLKRERYQTRNNTNIADNRNGGGQTNSNSNDSKVSNNTNANNTKNQKNRRSRPVYPVCETCGKTNHSTEKCYFGANAPNRPPPQNRRPKGQNQNQQRNAQGKWQVRWEYPSRSPNFKLETPCLCSGAAFDRPDTNERPKLPPIPEVVWQQPSETSTSQGILNSINNDSTSMTTVASQTSPRKGTQPQNYVVTTKQPSGNQTGKEPVPFLNRSKNSTTDIQKSEQHVTTTRTGDTTIPPLTITTPLIDEGLVRDEQTNEVYLPLTSTVVLKRKQEILHVPLDF